MNKPKLEEALKLPEVLSSGKLTCPKCGTDQAAVATIKVIPALPHPEDVLEVRVDTISGDAEQDRDSVFPSLRVASRPLPAVTLVCHCVNDCEFQLRFAFSGLDMATSVSAMVEAS